MANSGTGRASVPAVAKQFGVVSFLNDLASEMVYPLLPALVTLRLGAGAVALGTLDGVAEAASALVKLGSGWLADRRPRRRPLVVLGYLLAAVSRPLIGLAGGAWQVITLRGADRIGKGLRTPPRDAIIVDAAVSQVRARAFAVNRALDHAGAVVGPVVAWWLIAGGRDVPEVILWSALPGALAVLLVVWAVRPGGAAAAGIDVPPPSEAAPTDAGSDPRGLRTEPRHPRLLFGLIVVFAFARFPETLFLLRLQDAGVRVGLIPLVWSAMHVIRSTASYPGGWLGDRWGPAPAMFVGWVVYAAVCVGVALADTAGVAVAWFLVFGLVAAFTEAPERQFVAWAARAARRGRGFGIYHASVGLAALPGAVLLGWLYQSVGAAAALLVSGGVVVGCVIVGVRRR